MLSNFHTHTNFCDGNNSAEEMVLSAIDKGFSMLGFSGHGYTDFDLSYCMKDTPLYISEIKRLKEKYKDKIEIYLGVEEDIKCLQNRADFDYIIGSSHYTHVNGKNIALDSSFEGFKDCLKEWNGDILGMAKEYYESFCNYILKRKPDIIGHFDLLTKYDEMSEKPYYFGNLEYEKMAKKYVGIAVKSGCLIEVNTGAISRGYRSNPYPSASLLYEIKKQGGKLILSSDSHDVKTLDCEFDSTRKMLKDIGFNCVYSLLNGEFIKDEL